MKTILNFLNTNFGFFFLIESDFDSYVGEDFQVDNSTKKIVVIYFMCCDSHKCDSCLNDTSIREMKIK